MKCTFSCMHDILRFCWTGNYLKFYNAIRQAYPDIQMISNCDGSSRPLDHPADLYDFHVKFLLPNLFVSVFLRLDSCGSV